MSKITIDNKEYKLEDMSERAKGLAIHCRDVQTKILTKQMDLEQSITARNAYIADLKAELQKEDKSEAAEKVMARKSVQTVDSDLKSHERECEVRYQSILSQLEKMDKRIFRMEGLILASTVTVFGSAASLFAILLN